MLIPGMGEWYSRHIYPFLSGILSRFSSLFPLSIGDCFIYGSIAGLLIYLILSLIRRNRILRTLRNIAEYLAWVYVWFYLAWGLNYFRQNFYQRAGVEKVTYSSETFHSFLTAYTDSLNAAYYPVDHIDPLLVEKEIKKNYRELVSSFGMVSPTTYLKVKPMFITPLMSGVGVKGYMGPFFTEFNLNKELFPAEYPSTYAHELSHALGITNEAEANLYAFLTCSRSDIPEIRFSGYFSLLSYVLSNVYRVLSKEEFHAWRETLRPEIRALYNERVAHWQSLYSPLIGKAQDKLYNLFLKGNRIPTGTENYSEVVGLLIALQESESKANAGISE